MRIRASLAAVLALAGFLTAVASTGVESARRGAESRRSGLVHLIRERQKEVDELGESLAQLRRDVLARRRVLSDRSAADAHRVRSVQMRAGILPMAGPGVVVTLSNSTRTGRDLAEQAALAVRDVDVQLVVNALWASGAEAVAVNGQRLVATSPIRAAGETITVNFRPLAPPFEVRAIGAKRELFESSGIARRFRRWVEDLGLGFRVKAQDHIEVPGYLGRLQLSAARSVPPTGSEAGADAGLFAEPASPGMLGTR